MNNESLVSIIIPTHNRMYLLKNAVDSVLNQTYKNIEVIIVDDYSTDETKNLLISFKDDRIKYYRNEKNLYAAESRNVGIRKSSGDFVAFLDDDDEWLPEKLENQIPLFENKKVGLVYCSINLFFEAYNFSYNTEPFKKGMIYKDILIKNYIGATPSVIIKKQALQQLAGNCYFDPSYPAREEYDLWIRLSKNWEIDYEQKALVKQYYRKNIKRISSNVDNYVKGIELINKNHKTDVEELLTSEEKKLKYSLQQFFLGSQSIKIGNAKLARKYYLKAYKTNKNKKALFSYLLSFLGVKAILVSRLYFDKIKSMRNKV